MNRRCLSPHAGIVTALCGALLLAGCAAGPKRGEEYAPTYPVPPTPIEQNNGAIYQSGNAVLLFEDVKARRVGDLITIVLTERTDASKKASTSASKDSSVDIANPTLFGRPFSANSHNLEMQISGSRDFDGKADSSQSNKLTGNITVTVAQVLPNGNLVVRGEKWIALNQGEEYIQISGIVRPIDIRPDNTVLSTQVGDARISYSGKGELASANAMGWLTRFFMSALWPF
ncbi:MAG: flagellar basal body L-ring protein FlgH [Gammaproteobacteria bacterium]